MSYPFHVGAPSPLHPLLPNASAALPLSCPQRYQRANVAAAISQASHHNIGLNDHQFMAAASNASSNGAVSQSIAPHI